MFRVLFFLLLLLIGDYLLAQHQELLIQKELKDYLEKSDRLEEKDSVLLFVSRIEEVNRPALWQAEWLKVTKEGFLIQKNTFLAYFLDGKCNFIDEVDIEKSKGHIEALAEYSDLSPIEQEAIHDILEIILASKLNQLRSEKLLQFMEQELQNDKQDTTVIKLSIFDFDWDKAVIVQGKAWNKEAEELLNIKVMAQWPGSENSVYFVFSAKDEIVEVINIPKWRITQGFDKVAQRVLFPAESRLLLLKGQKDFLLN